MLLFHGNTMESINRLRLKAPLIAQFEITPKCNNKCGFCYNFWEYDKNSTLSRESNVDSKKIHGLMDVLLENEVPAVCFTGGEPFLAGETLFELIGKAKSNGLYTSINSNGRLIREREVKRLKDLGLNSALISLHGDSPVYHEEAVGCSNAFEETLLGIENLVNQGINVTVNYVSTQKNVDRIIPTAEMLKNLRVRNMTITPLLPFAGVKDHEAWSMKKDQFKQYFNSLVSARESGLNVDSTLPVAPCILKDMFPKDYEKYLDVLSLRVCMAGVSFAVVSPEGINRACIQAPELEEYGDNIGERFREGWKRANDWSKIELLPQECSEQCCALASCGGGCRTSSLAQNGTVEGKTMYMGDSISKEDASPFVKRMEVGVDRTLRTFRKRKGIKLRREEFGGVLVNARRQSFVILDHEGTKAYEEMPDKFKVDYYDKGLATLYASGMLHRSNGEDVPKYNQKIPIVHASRLFSRLAGNLPRDDSVRMLRADTGERIYF